MLLRWFLWVLSVCGWGELSLPIYLSQIPVINAVNTFGTGLSPWGKVAVGVVGVSLLTALLFGLYQWVSRRKRA